MGNCCTAESDAPRNPADTKQPTTPARNRYASRIEVTPPHSPTNTHSSARDSLATDVTTVTRSTLRISTRRVSGSSPCDVRSDDVASTDLHNVGLHQDPALADHPVLGDLVAFPQAEESGSMSESELSHHDGGKCTKEPSPSRLRRRIKIITLKARLLHGIDGVVGDCDLAHSPDQVTQTQLLECHSLRVRERVTAKIAHEEGNGANSVASETTSLMSPRSTVRSPHPGAHTPQPSMFSPNASVLSPPGSSAILSPSNSTARAKRLTSQVLAMQSELDREAQCDAAPVATPMACVHAWVVAVEEEVARCALLGIPTFPTTAATSTISESSCNLSVGNSTVMSRSHRQRFSLEASDCAIEDGLGSCTAPNGSFGARPPVAPPSPPPQHAGKKRHDRQ